MRYCYDTEFLEDGKTIELISIGIVCEDGREYYAVNHDMPLQRIHKDEWLMNNVWPHLPLTDAEDAGKTDEVVHGVLDLHSSYVKPKWVIRNEVREFLTFGIRDVKRNPDGRPYAWNGTTPEIWADYSAYDHVALCQLFGKMIDLPDFIPMWTNDLVQLDMQLQAHGYERPDQHNTEHNALHDARYGMAVLRSMLAFQTEHQ